MDTKRPVLLLDVDGVIAAQSKKGSRTVWPLESWRQRVVTDLDGVEWPVLYAQPVLDWLISLHESGLAEIRFHTTWQQHTRPLARALGLPEWPVAEAAAEFTNRSDSGYGPEGRSRTWWKQGAVERVLLDERRRLVWLDDDIKWEVTRGRESDLSLLLASPNVLALAPEPTIGITPKNIKTVNEWLHHTA